LIKEHEITDQQRLLSSTLNGIQDGWEKQCPEDIETSILMVFVQRAVGRVFLCGQFWASCHWRFERYMRVAHLRRKSSNSAPDPSTD